MARKTDIQYINFYTDGSAARKYELQQPKREERAAQPASQPQPQRQPRKKTVVYVDPLALCSIAVSVVMLVLMVAGVVQYFGVSQQEQAAQAYLEELRTENEALRQAYESGYDLEQIESDALALGMIPADQAQHITVSVEPVEITPVQETNVWDELVAFFAGLFA